MSMVEETDFNWAIILGGRRVGDLRQAPNGTFFSGRYSFPRLGIKQAAEELVYRRGIRRRTKGDPPDAAV